MKTLTITSQVTATEKNKEQGTTVSIRDFDKVVFEWKSYLKQERNHNLALAMFTK